MLVTRTPPPKNTNWAFCAGLRLNYCRCRYRLFGFFGSVTIIIVIVIVIDIVIVIVIVIEAILALSYRNVFGFDIQH